MRPEPPSHPRHQVLPAPTRRDPLAQRNPSPSSSPSFGCGQPGPHSASGVQVSQRHPGRAGPALPEQTVNLMQCRVAFNDDSDSESHCQPECPASLSAATPLRVLLTGRERAATVAAGPVAPSQTAPQLLHTRNAAQHGSDTRRAAPAHCLYCYRKRAHRGGRPSRPGTPFQFLAHNAGNTTGPTRLKSIRLKIGRGSSTEPGVHCPASGTLTGPGLGTRPCRY